jgi:CHAT domain-containing protein/Tfp pilus assembly protein PilF
LNYFYKCVEPRKQRKNKIYLAITFNNIGLTKKVQGHYEEARNYLKEALELCKKANQSEELSTILNNLGLVYDAQGNYDKAIQFYFESLQVDKNSNHFTQLNNLGLIYNFQGKYQEAIKFMDQALQSARNAGSPLNIATATQNLGLIYSDMGNGEKALEYYQEALDIFKKLQNRDGMASALANLIVLCSENNDDYNALSYSDNAISMIDSLNDPNIVLTIINNVTLAYSKFGKLEKFLSYFDKLLSLIDKVENPLILGNLLLNVGTIYSYLEKLDKSEEYFDKSLKILDDARHYFGDVESRQHFSLKFNDYYSAYFDILFKLSNFSKAYVISEANRSKTLNELIIESKSDFTSDGDSNIVAKDRETDYSLKLISRQISHTNNNEESERLKALQDSLYNIKMVIKEQLKHASPKYSAIKYPEPINVEEIKNELDEGTALLSYKAGLSNFYVSVITKNSFEIVKLDSVDIIKEDVNAFYNSIISGKREISKSFIKRNRTLYDKLLAPVEKIIGGKSTLLIIPDGTLYYLPFEALLTKDITETDLDKISNFDFSSLPHMIKDYDISYLPSATMLKIFKLYNGPEAPKDFICFADPVFASENETGISPNNEIGEIKKTLRSGKEYTELERLQATGVEADEISRLFNSESVTVYKREAANEDNLKKEDLSQYKYLHFATHGLINESKPQFSKLALSYDLASEEDGFLDVREIFELKLNAEMVVLSACETGLGKEVKGEGIIGLTRAFIVAGAKRVVVSLWSVSDESTKDLMIDFYKSINSGMSKSSALREAKLKMINSVKYSHPYYWAPFVMFGER